MPICLVDFLGRITRDRRGVTALEYAVLGLGIISGVALGVAALNQGITHIYAALFNDIKSAGG